jgi:hypothetical protein
MDVRAGASAAWTGAATAWRVIELATAFQTNISSTAMTTHSAITIQVRGFRSRLRTTPT